MLKLRRKVPVTEGPETRGSARTQRQAALAAYAGRALFSLHSQPFAHAVLILGGGRFWFSSMVWPAFTPGRA